MLQKGVNVLLKSTSLKKSSRLILLLLLIIVLASCGVQQTGGITAVSMVTQTPTNSVTPSISPLTVPTTSTIEATNEPKLSPTQQNSNYIPTGQDSIAWANHWMENIPCQPPCWEGIIPNTTNYTDTMGTLKLLPFVTSVRENKSYRPILVSWHWVGYDSFSNFIYFSDKDDNNPLVLTITLNFPNGFRLKNVLEKYGEPDYVWNSISTMYSTQLIYLNQGITITAVSKNIQELDDNTIFTGVIFTTPGSLVEYQNKIQYPYPLTILPKWQGYKSFNYYWEYWHDKSLTPTIKS